MFWPLYILGSESFSSLPKNESHNAPTSYLRTSGFTYLLHIIISWVLLSSLISSCLSNSSSTFCLCFFSYHCLSPTTSYKPLSLPIKLPKSFLNYLSKVLPFPEERPQATSIHKKLNSSPGTENLYQSTLLVFII